MPRTAKRQAPLLSIVTEDPNQAYMPGDTIVGFLKRTKQGVVARARVDIKLCGRAKAKIEVGNGNNNSTYRSRFRLIDERATRQLLHDGPVHIAMDGGAGEDLTWPFAVTLPTHVWPGVSKSTDSSYIPTDDDSVARQTLPPSSVMEYGDIEAFVEYWLEASIRGDAHGGDVFVATLPLKVRNYSTEPPIANFGVKLLKRKFAVHTQRLIPGMQNAELSAKDKMKKFFGSSSVPGFNFTLELGVPSVIQLEHTDPVPFTVRAVPNWGETSEILKGVPQKMAIMSFELKLVCLVCAQADGSFRAREEDEEVVIDLCTQTALARLRSHVMIPCTDEWPPVNIGEAINLRIGYNGSNCVQRMPWIGTGSRVMPSGSTYNMRVRYLLKWVVKIHVAGEDRASHGQQPVVILPATDPRAGPSGQQDTSYADEPPPLEERRTESWIVPPAEGDAPPTFTQVQKEDMLADEAKGNKDGEDDPRVTGGESSGGTAL